MKKRIVLLFSILVCILIISSILVGCNGSSTKTNKINLGDDKKTVLATMGDPDEEEGFSIFYYGKNYKSLLKEYEALDNKLDNASSFEDLDKLEAEYEKLEEKEASMEYEYTEISFDNSDKVEKVIFDKKHKTEDEADKELKNFTVISGGITKGKKTGKVTYKAEYTDGSYIIEQDYYISTKAGDTENSNSVEVVIKNAFGEITVNVPTIIGEYTITYNLNGGNINNTTGTYRESYKPGRAEITLTPPTRNGYTFEGWYDNEDLNGNAITTIAKESIGDKVYFAKWEIIVYTITYNLDGAKNNESNPTTYTIEDNKIFTLKEASKTDYAFIGWYLEPTFETSVDRIDTKSAQNMTLYAKFAVTKIKDNEFYGNKDLKTYDIPDSVTSIGEWAFAHCFGLTSITIPDSVTNIGNNAFFNCRSLTKIYYTGDIASWCGISGLEDLMVGSRTLYINGEELTGDLVIPNGVTTISSYAFAHRSTGLTSVTIPDSVTSIGYKAFGFCTGLESITVAENNPNYSSVDGILYNKEQTEIIFVPDAIKGAITLPDTLTSIEVHTFSYNRGLTSVTILDSVTDIGTCAFYYCTGLTSVTIPDSVTNIGDYAFGNCTGLTDINFNGTIEQWGEIYKSTDWNSPTGEYVIHCTDGDIEKS